MAATATKMRVFRRQECEVPGLGERIKEARKGDRRPLTEICRELSMSPTNWYRIEDEKQDLPLETLRRIEAVLGVSFDVEME